jgi:hypothetical protein
MILWAVRTANGLVPDGTESAGELAKVPFGKSVRVEVRSPRNPAHHRLYWTLCQRIASAIGADAENVSDLLKIETGHCAIVRSKKYGDVRLPRSISFASMDQNAFNEFFEKCLVVIQTEWGIARSDILEAVSDLIETQKAA